MWKYKGEEMGLEGIVGVPNRDMTDEEFAEANAKIGGQFSDQPSALVRSGLWEHIDDKPSPQVQVAPPQTQAQAQANKRDMLQEEEKKEVKSNEEGVSS